MSNEPPLERLGTPANIAEVVAFLAGPAHWVNGQIVCPTAASSDETADFLQPFRFNSIQREKSHANSRGDRCYWCLEWIGALTVRALADAGYSVYARNARHYREKAEGRAGSR